MDARESSSCVLRRGPAGWPIAHRLFVFRARHLDGLSIAPRRDILFRFPLVRFAPVLARHRDWRVRRTSSGSRAVRETFSWHVMLRWSCALNPYGDPVSRVTIRFRDAHRTEGRMCLASSVRSLGVLPARVRDRISTLRALRWRRSADQRTSASSASARLKSRPPAARFAGVEVIPPQRPDGARLTRSAASWAMAEYEGVIFDGICPASARGPMDRASGRQTAWGKGALVVTNGEEISPVKVGRNAVC